MSAFGTLKQHLESYRIVSYETFSLKKSQNDGNRGVGGIKRNLVGL